MIKNYFSALSVLFFLTAFSTAAQVVATSDYGEIPFVLNASMVIENVLANDLVNGQPATLANVTLTTFINNEPYVSIEADGSAWHTPIALEQPGVHIIHYRITEIANPFNYDIGTVTVNVGGCLLPDIEPTNVVTPTCSTAGSVTLTNLPNSNWTLIQWRNGIVQSETSGSGSSFAVNNLYGGIYHFSVYANGCQTLPLTAVLFSDCYLHVNYTSDYADLNSDGFVSPGDAINYQFSLLNGRETTVEHIILTSINDLLTINGDPIPAMASGATDNTNYTGVRLITQADINNGYVSSLIDYIGSINSFPPMPVEGYIYATTYLNISDGIRLNAFMDLNANGVQDVGEINFTQGNFHYEINGDGIVHHVNTNGVLSIYENNPVNSYDFGFDFDEPSPYYSLSTNAFQNITVAEGSGIVSYNFPIAVVPHNDFSISLTPYSAPRPGTLYGNRIIYKNNGTTTLSGTLAFEHGSAVSISSVSQTGTIPTSNGFTFTFNNLAPNETRSMTVALDVPSLPTVALGDVISNSATIAPAPDDVNPANNSSQLSQIIVGSYDPNDKTEAHGGKIVHSEFSANDYLTYTIRFENTGTANAINVKIDDVLDEKLDETSVRMVHASHNYRLDRVGKNLSWRFDAIQLPPSVEDTEIGHGFVTFQVKPKAGYAIGDVIPNTADIYFDTNPAIVTEPCLTEFTAPLGVVEFDADALSVYPNPTSSTTNISLNAGVIESIQLTDMLGKTVLTTTVGNAQAQIDLSALSSGMYFLKVNSAGAVKTIKIVKQ